MVRFGTCASRSLRSSTLSLSRLSAVNAVTATGTSCRVSSRLRAVTTIASRVPCSACTSAGVSWAYASGAQRPSATARLRLLCFRAARRSAAGVRRATGFVRRIDLVLNIKVQRRKGCPTGHVPWIRHGRRAADTWPEDCGKTRHRRSCRHLYLRTMGRASAAADTGGLRDLARSGPAPRSVVTHTHSRDSCMAAITCPF